MKRARGYRNEFALVSPDDLSTKLFCRAFVRKLMSERDDIKIHTINGYVEEFREYGDEIRTWGVRHHYVPFNRYVSPTEDVLFASSLARLYAKNGVTVAMHWTTKPNLYGPIAARISGVAKMVIAIRGLGSAFNHHNDLKGRLLHGIVCGLYRIACRLSHTVWFTNKEDLRYFLRKRLVKVGQVVLTKNAIDVEYYAPEAVDSATRRRVRRELGLSEEDQVVVMVARLLWPKGIRELVEASRIVARQHPRAKVILVAPPEDGNLLSVPQAYVREAQRDGHFLWLRFRRDVREIYAVSDVAVLPSFYKEGGYPRALLEPMGMGLPVVTTDTAGCRGPVEVGKNGYLVPARDEKGLAEAMSDLLADDQKRMEFGKYAREKVLREFDERKVVDKILKKIGVQECG